MPWQPSDAPRFSKKTNTIQKKRMWATVANKALEEYDDEGRAIRTANAAVKGK